MTSIHQLSASRSQPNRCHHQYDDTRCAALDALSDAVDWAYGSVSLRRRLRRAAPADMRRPADAGRGEKR